MCSDDSFRSGLTLKVCRLMSKVWKTFIDGGDVATDNGVGMLVSPSAFAATQGRVVPDDIPQALFCLLVVTIAPEPWHFDISEQTRL